MDNLQAPGRRCENLPFINAPLGLNSSLKAKPRLELAHTHTYKGSMQRRGTGRKKEKNEKRRKKVIKISGRQRRGQMSGGDLISMKMRAPLQPLPHGCHDTVGAWRLQGYRAARVFEERCREQRHAVFHCEKHLWRSVFDASQRGRLGAAPSATVCPQPPAELAQADGGCLRHRSSV